MRDSRATLFFLALAQEMTIHSLDHSISDELLVEPKVIQER